MTEMLLVRIVGILGSIFGGRGKVQYRADSYDAHHQKSPENVWYEKGSYKKNRLCRNTHEQGFTPER
jgi:hypothetical protein